MISYLFVAALFSLPFFVGSGRFGSVRFCFSGNTGLDRGTGRDQRSVSHQLLRFQ